MLTKLKKAIETKSATNVEDEIHTLGITILDLGHVPDELAFEILDLLKSEEMFKSDYASHLLNFFEYESDRISERAKSRCIGFLREWGDQFTNPYSQQVVSELRDGGYLK